MRTILIITFFIAGNFHSAAQFPGPNYEIVEYKGLYGNIVEDQDGFLWLSSRDGLLRFDGKKFTQIVSKNTKSKNLSLKVGKLLVHGNYLLAGSNKGLQIVNLLTHKSRQKYFFSVASDEILSNNVIDIQHSFTNEIVVLTSSSLYWLDESFEIIKEISLPEELIKSGTTTSLNRLVILNNEKIWIEGLFKEGQNYHLSLDVNSLNFEEEEIFNSISRYSLFDYNSEKIIYLSFPEKLELGFIDLENGKKSPLDIDLSFIKEIGYLSISPFSRDQLLLIKNLDHYLISLETNTIELLPTIYYDKEKTIPIQYWLYENQEGIRLGISEYGLIKFIDAYSVFRPLKIISKAFAEVSNIDIQQIYFEGNYKWLLSHGWGGAIFLNDQLVTKIIMGSEESPYPNFLWNISKVSKDTFWIGTSKGLFWYEKSSNTYGRLSNPKLPDAIHAYAITTQFIDSQNFLWMGIGYGNGVIRWAPDREHFIYYPNTFEEGGIPIRYPKAIAEDKNGDLWMGCQTGGGLVKWDRKSDSFEVIKASINGTFNNELIDVIAVGSDDNIYFGGGGGGVFSYNPIKNSFDNWSEEDGLSNNYFSDLLWDNSGKLWIATLSGLDRLNPKNGDILNLYTTHGLPSNQVEALQQLSNDSIIVHCIGGSSIFHPKSTSIYQPSGPVKITQIRINDRDSSELLIQADEIKLNSFQNNIAFEISQANLIDAEYNEYFYRLVSMGNEWKTLKSNNNLNLFGLSPGQYEFQFRICSNGNLCKDSETIAFRIQPPFLKSNLFYFLLFLLIGFLVWLYIKIRLNAIRKNIELRNNISKDLHDDIGSSLSSIQFLSEIMINDPADQEVNKSRMLSIKEGISNISENVEEIIWHIKPTNDLLEKIHLRLRRFTSEILEAKGIDLHWNQDQRLSDIKLTARKKRDYFLIFKEVINNIAKHANARNVEVQVNYHDNMITLKIVDDGKGFDTSGPFNTTGLESIKNRTKSLGGTLDIKSHHGEGCAIALKFPVR